MRLVVKTLTQKTLVVDIDDSKTVLDLKQELSLFPDVGVRPEYQKLIYTGKILENADRLSVYNIDTEKFLVVMTNKNTSAAASAPIAESTATTSQNAPTTADSKSSATTAAAATETSAPVTTTPNVPTAATVAAANEQEAMVANIVNMGYSESEARRALQASFYSPERAIEYLVEGIPDFLDDTDTDAADLSAQPFQMLRDDPLFRQLRRTVQQHPDTLNEVVAQITQNNPALLNVIRDNQQEFLNMLLSADDSDDEEEAG